MIKRGVTVNHGATYRLSVLLLLLLLSRAVCAKDLAGLWSCAEKSVGVPLRPAELKHIVPEDQGKLFVVAEDAGFYNAAPNEIPFRNENTDLNGACPVVVATSSVLSTLDTNLVYDA